MDDVEPRSPLPPLPALEVLGRPGVLELPAVLRGHVAAVLFWRRFCVHSRHALQTLAALQQRFVGQPFVVAAVHSAAFDAEDSLEGITAEASGLLGPLLVLREGDCRAFAAVAGQAWPTLALLDAQGRVAFQGRGEPRTARLVDAIEFLLQEARQRRALTEAPLVPTALHPLPAAPLQRPRGVAVLGDRLVVVEGAAHRLLVADRATGRVLRAVGSGIPGTDDGPADEARFRSPVGIAIVEGRALVADAGNHSLRTVDLDSGEVATVCGNGRPSTDRYGGGFGVLQGLCSPVGVVAGAADAAVWIVQAGAHQVWQFDPTTQAASAWLGSGAAMLRDGSGEQAAFAQPWAAAAADGVLWIADAGNGALRRVDLAHAEVRTRATGFRFPVAVAVLGDEVFVADAGRAELLALAADGSLRVVAGSEHGLVEPAALAVAGAHLVVADAGAHCLFEFDPRAQDTGAPGGPLRRIDLQDVPPPADVDPDDRLAVVLPEQQVAAGAEVTVELELHKAEDEALDPALPATASAVDETGGLLATQRHGPMGWAGPLARVELATRALPGRGTVRLEVRASVRDEHGVPMQREWRFVLPLRLAPGGATNVQIVAG